MGLLGLLIRGESSSLLIHWSGKSSLAHFCKIWVDNKLKRISLSIEHLPECSPMEEKLENGELSCHPDLSSPYCSAYCNEEYHVKPRYARYINCVGAEIWDKPVPKCVRNGK